MNRVRKTRHSNNISAIHTRHNYFKDLFFPSAISERINLASKIRNTESLSMFKRKLLNFIRPNANSTFNIHNLYGIKLLTWLRLDLSHHDHKFRHCFQDTLNPLFDCGNDTETITCFFYSLPKFPYSRTNFLNNNRKIIEQILSHCEDQLIQTFLYGNPNFNLAVNWLILNAVI